jgi:Glycosyl transferases group 1
VLPSLEDNLPNTMLEAMSCGTPVAGFDSGGVPDLLTDGVTGQLAPVGHARKLGEAIASLLSDPPKLEVMGQNCRRTIQQRCSVERQAEVLHQLYGELCKGAAGKESSAGSGTDRHEELGPHFRGIFPQLFLAALRQLKKVQSDAKLTEAEQRRRLRCVARLERLAPAADPKEIISSRWMERLRIELHLEGKAAPSALRRLTRLVKNLGA